MFQAFPEIWSQTVTKVPLGYFEWGNLQIQKQNNIYTIIKYCCKYIYSLLPLILGNLNALLLYMVKQIHTNLRESACGGWKNASWPLWSGLLGYEFCVPHPGWYNANYIVIIFPTEPKHLCKRSPECHRACKIGLVIQWINVLWKITSEKKY